MFGDFGGLGVVEFRGFWGFKGLGLWGFRFRVLGVWGFRALRVGFGPLNYRICLKSYEVSYYT